MARYAGQMLPTGTSGTQGEDWVPTDGRYLASWRKPHYHARTGWRSGMTGIHRTRVPNVAGFSVLLTDDPAGANLPPDTPHASDPVMPPPPSYVTVANPGDHPAGSVPISGTVSPSAPVEAAPLIGGVEGTFVPMTTISTLFTGHLTMVAGVGVQVRVRVVGHSYNRADSAPFTIT